MGAPRSCWETQGDSGWEPQAAGLGWWGRGPMQCLPRCRQVKEYDSISRLDQWLTTMLLRIKKTIQGDEEDLR